MKTLDQIKHSIAVKLESVYHSWDDLTVEQQNDMWPFVMQEYLDQGLDEYKAKLKERLSTQKYNPMDTPSEDKPDFEKFIFEVFSKHENWVTNSNVNVTNVWTDLCKKIWTDYVEPFRDQYKKLEISKSDYMLEIENRLKDKEQEIEVLKSTMISYDVFSKLEQSNRELLEALNDNKAASDQAMTALERYGKGSQKKQENLHLTEIAECLYAISNPDAEVIQSEGTTKKE